MARLTPLSQSEAAELLLPLGLQPESLAALDAGSVNSNFRFEARGQRYFLRIYEEQGEAGARAELELLDALASAGVPVARALAQGAEPFLAIHAGKAVAVFPWLEGESLCQARVDATRCEALGRALGRMHAAPHGALPTGRFGVEALQARFERVRVEAPALAADAAVASAALTQVAARRRERLPEGLCHGDLFRDNVLWQRARLVALLDFESASSGPWVYDLAVCIHAWCFADDFVPELCRALLAGYQAERPLSEVERESFGVEAAFAALRFVATRMTDYSMRAAPGEPPLRDYRRFLARYRAVEQGRLQAMLAFPH
ncbi:MAG: homoserine kinase [Polyangiaceae bacterium]